MEEHCFRHDNFFYIKIFVITKTTLILSNIYFIFLSLQALANDSNVVEQLNRGQSEREVYEGKNALERSFVKIMQSLWTGGNQESIKNLIKHIRMLVLIFNLFLLYSLFFFRVTNDQTNCPISCLSGLLLAIKGGSFEFMSCAFDGMMGFSHTCMTCHKCVLSHMQFQYIPIYPDRRYISYREVQINLL